MIRLPCFQIQLGIDWNSQEYEKIVGLFVVTHAYELLCF